VNWRPIEPTVVAAGGQTTPQQGRQVTPKELAPCGQADTPGDDHSFLIGCGEPLAGGSGRLLAFLATGSSLITRPRPAGRWMHVLACVPVSVPTDVQRGCADVPMVHSLWTRMWTTVSGRLADEVKMSVSW
jgi:hypothetical protein